MWCISTKISLFSRYYGYQSKQNILNSKTFILSIFLLISNFNYVKSQTDCLSIGEWSNWGSWSSCGEVISGVEIKHRIRNCTPVPANCTQNDGIECSGHYSETSSCVESTTELPTTIDISTSLLTTILTTSSKSSTTPSTTTEQQTTTQEPIITTTEEITTTESSTTISTTTPATTSTTTSTSTTTTIPATTSTISTTLTTTISSTISTTRLPTSTIPTTTLTSTTSNIITTTDKCSNTAWNDWLEWSTCTDTCGMCGVRQRFRTCNKSDPTCSCIGGQYQKEFCNDAICKYPRPSPCCNNYVPSGTNNKFVCILPNSTTT
uniref:Thrombospondin n=1 Tax=Strongyloides papillosus TaxID=174720 RepID=A0A0N5B651_STREA